MLVHIGFFVAGFFWPALPWGPAVAVLFQALGSYLQRYKYIPWLDRPKKYLAQILLMQFGMAIAINTVLMLASNWIIGRI